MIEMPRNPARYGEPRTRIAHVAFFVPTLLGGGAERVTVILANEFASLVDRVDLLVGDAAGPWRAHVSEHVRLVELGSVDMGRCFVPLVRYLRRERPDCMLSNLSYANFWAALARTVSRQPIPLFVREASTLSLSLASLSGLESRIFAAKATVACRLADGIVAPMEDVATDLSRTLGRGLSRKIHVLPNPLNLEEIEVASREPVPSLLSRVPHPWIVGCGRLVREKGYDTLLRAVAQVRTERSSPPSLIILGEGQLRRDLQGLARALGIESRTFLPGFVDNPFSVLRRAAVFVLSSRQEGCPSALLQAMACGATVVATNCPSGPREIIRNEREGSLVPMNDPAALAAAITDKLARPNDPQVARERVQAFAAERIARQLLAVFATAFANEKRTPLGRHTASRVT
jgi:glycosyltransferase involved in cell wall biosynthesis